MAKEASGKKSGKDCKINKFDGLCHGKDGTVYHPNGIKKMGVNEWLSTDNGLMKKAKHHHKHRYQDME